MIGVARVDGCYKVHVHVHAEELRNSADKSSDEGPLSARGLSVSDRLRSFAPQGWNLPSP